jgi:hypothetical protein
MEQTATIKEENITEVKVSDKTNIDSDGFLDVWQRKITSRRFLAWIVSCGLVVAGSIDGDAWVALTMVFIGAEILEKYKGIIEMYFNRNK